jgi:FAD-dependent urate hydroxylase
MSSTSTHLAIIGAGPFGLSAAAMARSKGIPAIAYGKPMELWRRHMPRGMLLRSAKDWHLDPCDRYTLEAFLARHGTQPSDPAPIAIEQFLDYAAWFRESVGIAIDQRYVRTLTRRGDTFDMQLDDGERVTASAVLCAPGVRYFRHTPQEYVAGLSNHLWCHSTEICDLDLFRGMRCLVIGGRQSAYELATLLEFNAGADVTIVHRHPSPAFTESDWSWVADELRTAETTPGWFAHLSKSEQEAIHKRFWGEGRLKLEPWLGERMSRAKATVYANTTIDRVEEVDGRVRATLNNGVTLRDIDVIVLATGFKVDLQRVPYMTPSLLAEIECVDGYPVLDSDFQSVSVPGLYFAGLVAARDFGPYMGFLASCPFAGRRLVGAIARSMNAEAR